MRDHNDNLGSLTAVILCGGLGTRLRQITGNTPKVLALVGGVPFLHHVLLRLRRSGFREVVLCTGFAAEQVVAFCGEGAPWDLKVQYSTEDRPLGTGGALAQARDYIHSDLFLVLNGDSWAGGSLGALLGFHVAKHAAITMALVKVPDQTRFGSVSLAADGTILGFNEKGGSGPGLINAGMYWMDRHVVDAIPARHRSSLETDIFPGFVRQGLCGFVVAGPFIDIGTPESWAEAQQVLPTWLTVAST